jgi:WD40 repeat protein
VPFPRNPDFVGRSDDLKSLHAVLQKREPGGIRPTGLTGMGGIGKTQLAVEYAYRHKGDYPGGIFWVNAAEPLAQGLAQLGARLRPEVRGEPPDRQLQVAFEELSRRPDALLVFDNIEDPAQLSRSVGTESSSLTLGCPILFTTRRRDLGRFHAVELSVLPEGPALQLLLRHDCRQAVLNDPQHPERPQVEAVCRLLGYLPLALELASAFLAEWPDVPLADYRERLEQKGCLPTLDSEARNLAGVNFQPIHEAAVAATLQTQWETLRSADDETARLVFRTAGQFAEAAAISTATLGLFTEVPDVGGPGDPSPLRRALKRLHAVRLVEELLERHVRLHPLVREFSAALTPPEETPPFRHECACRVAEAFNVFIRLEEAVQADGIDALNQILTTALAFALESDEGTRGQLSQLLRLFQRECHHLRGWDSTCQPATFAQQVLFRARTLGFEPLAAQAERRLKELAQPVLVARWRTLRESHTLVRILDGHRNRVSCVAVSPDGRHVVTGSDDETAAVWDLQTGQRLHVLAERRGRVRSVAVSPDGRHVVTGSDDETAAVWDLQTGQRLREFAGHRGQVMSVVVTPDGQHVVSAAADDKTVIVWDLDTGTLVRELIGHQGRVGAVAVTPDGRHVVSGSFDTTVAVWDLSTGARIRELAGHRGRVRAVAISPDGRHVVSASKDQTLAVWDLQTGQRLRVLTGHQRAVTSVAVTPDGRRVVSAADDDKVMVWELETGTCLYRLTGHRGRVTSVAVTPDGRYLVSASNDTTAAVWDLQTSTWIQEVTGHQGRVWSVAMTPDGRRLVSAADDKTVAVWDLGTGTHMYRLTGHENGVRTVVVTPDGRLAVSGSFDTTVAVWDLSTGARIRELAGHQGAVTSVAVTPDGRHLASGSFDQTVMVWDLESGKPIHRLIGHRDWVNSVAVTPDGRYLVSASKDQTLAVWDPATGQRLRELIGHRDRVWCVAVTPDGRYAVSGSHDETVAVWDLHTGARTRVLTGHRRAVMSVAVSPDGRHLVSGSYTTVAVWDFETGALLAAIALDGSVPSVTWHQNGRLILAGDAAGNLYCLEYRGP